MNAISLTARLSSGPAFAVLSAAIVVIFFLVADPIPQDPAYHQFADGRRLLGVPNLLNVISNLAFLIVGLWGLTRVRLAREQLPWTVLFMGLVLTAFGSAWYHLAPNNDTLFWDRLPMTIAFSGFAAALVIEYFSARAAKPTLGAMLVAGVGSVLYWSWTEAQGSGDLRPYAVIAILPILIVPLVLATRGGRSPMTPYFWAMILLYVPAKLFEHFDAATFTGEIVSGHTLKHVFAAISTGALAIGLERTKS